MRVIKIDSNEAGQRLDKFLKKYFKEAGSGFLYKMLRKKNILLNRKKAQGGELLSCGDEISVFMADETIEKFRGKQEAIVPVKNSNKLHILYEDKHFLVVNKPAGMLSQKAAVQDVSLNEYLISYLLEKGEITQEQLSTFRPAVCNRLDRNTSGIVLCGKTLPGLQVFSGLLKERTLRKYYLCLVHGHMKEPIHETAYLKKDHKNNTVKIYHSMVQDASVIETGYEPLWSNGEVTLLKVELFTGKTHQIRSHLASLGYFIVGDPKYGYARDGKAAKKGNLKRQFLHAWQIQFPIMNTKEAVSDTNILNPLSGRMITAALPDELAAFLEKKGCPLKY